MRDPDFTLAAGPTAASARTLAALGSPITYHYDPVFLDAFRRTEAKVGQLFRTKNEVILMQGEAILGLEAAARSLVRPGMPVLNLVSGPFGKGMGYWLKNFGADLHELEVPYDQAVAPDAVERYLDEHPETELLCVVHSETPSGTFNDCALIGPMARSRGVLTLVDCVSSLGGMPLDADSWQLDVCVAGPQKCLGGPPGMSLVGVSEQAWAAIEGNPVAPRASFLSLLDWREQWHGRGQFPYTPSVCDIHGVEAACDQVLEEGLEASIARHEAAARACRAGAREMGLRLWPASEDIAAACVTAVAVPGGLDHEAVRNHVREHYGVMLSSGQGAGNLVRIGHMGPTADGLKPVVGLMALGRSLADLGATVRIGAGVETALALLAPLPLSHASCLDPGCGIADHSVGRHSVGRHSVGRHSVGRPGFAGMRAHRVGQGRLEPLRGDPDVRRGQHGGLFHVAQPDSGEDRAMLGQRPVQAAAQGEGPCLEPADLALQPMVHLLQLLVPAQLAERLVELDVHREEVPDGVGLHVIGHLIDELAEAGQVGLCHSGDGEPDREDLERLANLVGVDELLRSQRADFGPAPRPDRDQPLGRQAAHSLADRAAAYLEHLGERHLRKLCSGGEPLGQDLFAQVLIDPLRQCQVVERLRH